MLIYILGTDGAGKTTVAQRLAQQSFANHRPIYFYCQHRPFLHWLLKLPARLLFLRRTDQFKDYDRYKARKDTVSSRLPWVTRLYAMVSYLDAWLQTWPKMLWARTRSGVVLVDRYYLDWVVNAGVLQRTSPDAMLRDARGLERVLPRAQLHVFLDVSEETAFQRKNDIQALQYLRERKERYLQLAGPYGFHIIDANQDAETVFQQVRALVEATVKSGTAAPDVASSTQQPVKQVAADVRRL